MLKTKRGKIIVTIITMAIILGSIVINQLLISTKKAYKIFNIISESTRSDSEYSWLESVYDGKCMFKKLEYKNIEKGSNMIEEDIINSFLNLTGGTIEDYNKVEIVDYTIKSDYANYSDAYITFKNNSSKTIKYIAFDIYFYNKNGNFIGTEYTSDNNRIRPGAQQTINAMIKKY